MKKTVILMICCLLWGMKIIDFEFKEESNQIAVIFRQPIGYNISESGTLQNRIWKEIYGVKNGKIILLKTIEGKYIPSQWIEEKIIFDELKD